MTETEWMPQINHNRCTGCKICIQICPTEALAQSEEKATLAYPERCTYCAACEDICPVGAIELPFLVLSRERYTS